MQLKLTAICAAPRRQDTCWLIAAIIIITVLQVASESLLLTARHSLAYLAPDHPAAELLTSGLYRPEQDERSSYRWTAGSSQLHLPLRGQANTAFFELQLGPTFPDHPASTFSVSFAEQPPTTITLDDQPRRYTVMVPRRALSGPHLPVTLQSDTVVMPPDTRPVGLRVEYVRLHTPTSVLISVTPLYGLLQFFIITACALILRRLMLPTSQVIGSLVLVAGVLVLLTFVLPLLVYSYVLRWTVALGLLLLLTFVLLPLAERHLTWIAPPPLLRTLWGIALLACAIRLTGSLHPLFEAFDLGLNVERFLKTVAGDLVVTSRSIEFRNNITVYPPGAYLTLLPLALLHIPPPLLIQGSLAIIDGFGALTTGALARMLGTDRRTAIFSALVYAAVPIHLTALWFGLTAQIFGQALTAPLAIALLIALRSDRWRDWLAAGFILTISLLTHIGVAITNVAWLGLIWLLVRWRRELSVAAWWRFAGIVAISCLISFISIYGVVAILKIEQFLLTVEKVQTSGYVPAYGLIARAFPVSFTALGLLLIPPGLLLLLRKRLPIGGSTLIVGWVGVVLIFLAIELISALQVRYIYFVVPLACTAIGLILAALERRAPAGRYAAWGVVVFLLVQSSIVWYTAAAEDVMMSMIPLLR